MNDVLCEEVTAILERKLAAWEAFIAVTHQLRQALEEEDDDATGPLIARRAAVIETVTALDRCLQRRRPGPEGDTLPVETLLGRIGRTVREAVLANRACDAAAENRRDALRQALVSLNRTQTGLRQYREGSRQEARFLEVRS